MGSIKKIRILLAVAAIIAVYSANCYATPTLQLNIGGGTYNSATQTVVAPTNTASNIFKLYAYLIEDRNSNDLVSDTYYISLALSPQVSSPMNPAAFVFSGQTLNVSSDMTYGTPPLSSHGVFPTYFTEWAFTFNPSLKTQEFNTQDNPGLNPTLRPYVDRPMFYQEFAVDVSNLDPNYTVHFDLYSKQDRMQSVTYFTDNPTAYVPATPESCSNGSTSYPQCTIVTSTTTNYPSAYRAAYTSCKKGNESGPYCIDKKGNPNPGDVINHPESCTNDSTTYPSCALTTASSREDNSAYVPAVPEHCTNGSTSYPACTTSTVGLVASGQSDLKSFAPYSHDAEGGYHDVLTGQEGEDSQNVPENNSAVLMLTGLVLLGIAVKRRRLA